MPSIKIDYNSQTTTIDFERCYFRSSTHLKVNTGIHFKVGSEKTLKLHIIKLPENHYAYHLGNLKRLSSNHLTIKINDVPVQVIQASGAINSLCMIPIGCTLNEINNKYLYSTRTFKESDYSDEVSCIQTLNQQLASFLAINPSFKPYAERGLALPQMIKAQAPTDHENSPLTVHDIMLNGAKGDLQNNPSINFSAIKQMVEGLWLLWAAGYIHVDIKTKNIIHTANGGMALIDFGLSASKKNKNKNCYSGTVKYFSPKKLALITERAYIEDDLHGLCLSFLKKFLVANKCFFADHRDKWISLLCHPKSMNLYKTRLTKDIEQYIRELTVKKTVITACIQKKHATEPKLIEVLLCMLDIYHAIWTQTSVDNIVNNASDVAAHIRRLSLVLDITDHALVNAVIAQCDPTQGQASVNEETTTPCSYPMPTVTAFQLAEFSKGTCEQNQVKKLTAAILKELASYQQIRFSNGFWANLYAVRSSIFCGQYSATDKQSAITAVKNALLPTHCDEVTLTVTLLNDPHILGTLTNRQLQTHLAQACQNWQQSTVNNSLTYPPLTALHAVIADKTDDTTVVKTLIDFLKAEYNNHAAKESLPALQHGSGKISQTGAFATS